MPKRAPVNWELKSPVLVYRITYISCGNRILREIHHAPPWLPRASQSSRFSPSVPASKLGGGYR